MSPRTRARGRHVEEQHLLWQWVGPEAGERVRDVQHVGEIGSAFVLALRHRQHRIDRAEDALHDALVIAADVGDGTVAESGT